MEKFVPVDLSLACVTQNKKADVAEHPEEFHHVGLLVNRSSAAADYPLFSRPTTSQDITTYQIVLAVCDQQLGHGT